MISVVTWTLLLLVVFSPVARANDVDSEGSSTQEIDANMAARKLQQLDSSTLEFDFFEVQLENRTDTDEYSLFKALELLDQTESSDSLYQENMPLDKEEQALEVFEPEPHEISENMDEELESVLDQEISEELNDF